MFFRIFNKKQQASPSQRPAPMTEQQAAARKIDAEYRKLVNLADATLIDVEGIKKVIKSLSESSIESKVESKIEDPAISENNALIERAQQLIDWSKDDALQKAIKQKAVELSLSEDAFINGLKAAQEQFGRETVLVDRAIFANETLLAKLHSVSDDMQNAFVARHEFTRALVFGEQPATLAALTGFAIDVEYTRLAADKDNKMQIDVKRMEAIITLLRESNEEIYEKNGKKGDAPTILDNNTLMRRAEKLIEWSKDNGIELQEAIKRKTEELGSSQAAFERGLIAARTLGEDTVLVDRAICRNEKLMQNLRAVSAGLRKEIIERQGLLHMLRLEEQRTLEPFTRIIPPQAESKRAYTPSHHAEVKEEKERQKEWKAAEAARRAESDAEHEKAEKVLDAFAEQQRIARNRAKEERREASEQRPKEAKREHVKELLAAYIKARLHDPREYKRTFFCFFNFGYSRNEKVDAATLALQLLNNSKKEEIDLDQILSQRGFVDALSHSYGMTERQRGALQQGELGKIIKQLGLPVDMTDYARLDRINRARFRG